MKKLTCKKNFTTYFEVGKEYENWTNFEGLNHMVRDLNEEIHTFNPSDDPTHDSFILERPYIWDYFYTIDEYRDLQLDKILLK